MRKRLRDKLSNTFPPEELRNIYNSFDVIGDIAIIKISPTNVANGEAVAKQIMAVNINIKTVLTPVTRITGDFRVRNLKLLAGENKTSTTHKESGCTFKVEVERCYFSPRLSHEHLRIAKLVQPGETVVNMFAGVGCFSIIIAKTQNRSKVYSIDVNPTAVRCMVENVRINQVFDRVFPILGDAKDIIKTQLQGVADRVLMPLPEKALEYLPSAISALKPAGGWIHYHCFEHAEKNEDPIKNAKLKLIPQLSRSNVDFEINLIRLIRKVGPNWHQIVADINIKGFDKF